MLKILDGDMLSTALEFLRRCLLSDQSQEIKLMRISCFCKIFVGLLTDDPFDQNVIMLIKKVLEAEFSIEDYVLWIGTTDKMLDAVVRLQSKSKDNVMLREVLTEAKSKKKHPRIDSSLTKTLNAQNKIFSIFEKLRRNSISKF